LLVGPAHFPTFFSVSNYEEKANQGIGPLMVRAAHERNPNIAGEITQIQVVENRATGRTRFSLTRPDKGAYITETGKWQTPESTRRNRMTWPSPAAGESSASAEQSFRSTILYGFVFALTAGWSTVFEV
jgi:hypothetical protein